MTTVTLNISRTEQAGYTLATDIKPNSERTYYYQYTGGNTAASNGDITTPTGTPISFTVSLGTGTSGYIIKNVKFEGPSNNDGSKVIAADERSVVITDAAQHKGEMTYCLKLEDDNDDKKNTFDCDPKITNT
jgi:hypothetical protein